VPKRPSLFEKMGYDGAYGGLGTYSKKTRKVEIQNYQVQRRDYLFQSVLNFNWNIASSERVASTDFRTGVTNVMPYKTKIGRGLVIGLLLAATALPSAALAGNEDRARAADGAAQAKIETGDKLGVTDQAADIQARARVALEAAKVQIKDDDEDQAYHAARHAIALADLAIVTAELKTLTTQRDQLAAR
jgi:hypothetical protein